MGYDSQIPTAGRDSVKIQHGEFNKFLYVPSLAANLLSVYQMTHTGSPKKVTFDSNLVEITEQYYRKIIAKGIANHSTTDYGFSHFFPISPPKTILTHANNTSEHQ